MRPVMVNRFLTPDYGLFEIQNVIDLNMCHAQGEYTSLDIRKVYACVFQTVKSTMCMLFKHRVSLIYVKSIYY